MDDKINTTSVVIKQKTGTWKYAKDLLEEWGKKSDKEYIKELSKNPRCRYFMFSWLEENNKIKNHTLEENTSVCIPKESADYEQIVSVKGAWSMNQNPKLIPFYDSIMFEDCIVFQHKQQPGLDKDSSSKIISKLLEKNQIYSSEKISEYVEKYIDKETVDITAEDIKSGDLTAEEIVKNYPDLESTIHDYLELKKKTSKSDDKSISQAIDAQHKEFEKIVKEAKKEMKDLMKHFSVFEWQKLAMKMYDRFCSNDGSDYKDNLLNRLFTKQNETKTCIKDFRERFEEYIKKYNYDIVSFNIFEFHNSVYGKGETGIRRPILGDFPHTFSKKELKKLKNIGEVLKGPTICFHDTQGFNVDAKEIQIKNGKFSCKLLFDFYDHFGLDLKDIESFSFDGFESWYLLQHLNENYKTGCKAFVNHIIHEETLEIEIEN